MSQIMSTDHARTVITGTAYTPTRWRPILGGHHARAAWEAIDAIADGLEGWYATPGHPTDATLAGGAAGAAIFFDYLARAQANRPDRRQIASDLLREAAGGLTSGTRGVGLHEGVAGVVWAATHLRGAAFDPATERGLAQVDAGILSYLERTPWPDHFDLIGGLVGLGLYGLERLPRPAAAGIVVRVVQRLDELAERGPGGVTWKTPQALLPDGQRERLPNGWHNLGVAHGVPGIIGILAETCAAGLAVEKARPLLHGAVTWLVAQQLPADSLARFPHCIAPELPPSPSRLSWCFGDAGIAATLLLAAHAENVPAWEQAALEIGRHAAARTFETSSVQDAGLCHGAAGVAHIFNRLFQATADPVLAEAARTWIDRALSLRQPSVAVAGFPSGDPDASGRLAWTPDPGLLTGAAGVGLALLAAVTDLEPAWDRSLLLAIRPVA